MARCFVACGITLVTSKIISQLPMCLFMLRFRKVFDDKLKQYQDAQKEKQRREIDELVERYTVSGREVFQISHIYLKCKPLNWHNVIWQCLAEQ